jgi:hypothetical protein
MLASVCARKESYEQHRFESTNSLLLAAIEIEQVGGTGRRKGF